MKTFLVLSFLIISASISSADEFDEVKAAWDVVDPVLTEWASQTDYIDTYCSGSWGPEGSQKLFEHSDQKWRTYINPHCAE